MIIKGNWCHTGLAALFVKKVQRCGLNPPIRSRHVSSYSLPPIDSSLKLKPFFLLFFYNKSTAPNYSGSYLSSPNSRLSSVLLYSLRFTLFFLHFHPITASFLSSDSDSDLDLDLDLDLGIITTVASKIYDTDGSCPLNPVHGRHIQDRNFNHPWRLSWKVLASSGSSCSVTLSAIVDYNG